MTQNAESASFELCPSAFIGPCDNEWCRCWGIDVQLVLPDPRWTTDRPKEEEE